MDRPLADYESASSEKEEGLALKTATQKLMTRVRLYIAPKARLLRRPFSIERADHVILLQSSSS
jgi:hypothetical protein